MAVRLPCFAQKEQTKKTFLKNISIFAYTFVKTIKTDSYMDERKLEIWWSSLTISQKERIGGKIMSKQTEGKVNTALYPECSRVWNALSIEQKQAIYDHCTDDHGYLLQEWKEGRAFSY